MTQYEKEVLKALDRINLHLTVLEERATVRIVQSEELADIDRRAALQRHFDLLQALRALV